MDVLNRTPSSQTSHEHSEQRLMPRRGQAVNFGCTGFHHQHSMAAAKVVMEPFEDNRQTEAAMHPKGSRAAEAVAAAPGASASTPTTPAPPLESIPRR